LNVNELHRFRCRKNPIRRVGWKKRFDQGCWARGGTKSRTRH